MAADNPIKVLPIWLREDEAEGLEDLFRENMDNQRLQSVIRKINSARGTQGLNRG